MSKAKKTKTTATKKRGAKQTEIPGTERATTPAIEEAAAALRETRTEWQKLGKLMDEESQALIDVMTVEKVSVYKFMLDDEELVVKLSDTKRKVSIQKAKTPAAAQAGA